MKCKIETQPKKKLLIIGAGGHGRVVSDVAAAVGTYQEIAFLDDSVPAVKPAYPIIGKAEDAGCFIGEWAFFVAIGNSSVRKRITETLKNNHAVLEVLIHPSAILGSDTYIGEGSVVMPGVIINNHAKIGKSVILNTGCSVDHDCIIGDYCHIAVGAHLCGTVQTENDVWIGAGATVINNVTICGDCMIGAGAVVVRDIDSPGTYLGVPAKPLISR